MYTNDTAFFFNLQDFDPATREKNNSELKNISVINLWLKIYIVPQCKKT